MSYRSSLWIQEARQLLSLMRASPVVGYDLIALFTNHLDNHDIRYLPRDILRTLIVNSFPHHGQHVRQRRRALINWYNSIPNVVPIRE
jgi:hypothetical protein